MNTEEEDLPRSAPPGVRTALRDPNLQIRLLLLDAAGSDEDTISASLEVWDKGDAPTYRAISYVCGDAQRMQDVTVNGSRVSVRHNCYYALWQTRLHFPESRVWIDAVCINQLDLEEKAAQVAMMFETYYNAAQVLACIGPSDTHSDAVDRAVEDPIAAVQNLSSTWTHKPIRMDLLWHPPLDEASAAQFYGHYNKFSMRPYFGRVWILQELAGGQEPADAEERRDAILLLCGQKISDWLDLADLNRRLLDLGGPYTSLHASRIDDIYWILTSHFYSDVDFPFYLRIISELECQDARDRVYSTCAFVNWSSFGQTSLIPDYQISAVELALQLVDRISDTDLENVEIIAKALDLLNPSTISKVLKEVHANRLNTRKYQAFNASDRWWSVELRGVQMVQHHPFLRLFLTEQHIDHPELSSLSTETLVSRNLSPIHKEDTFAGVASEDMQAGDIVIESGWFGLVLRPHDDGDRFSIVGDAFMVDGFQLGRKAPFANECDCHERLWLNREKDNFEFVHIAVELSNEEALAVVVNGLAMKNGDCLLHEYLESGTFGGAKAGSDVWDVTAEKMRYTRNFGVRPPPCAEHKAGDYYWKYEKHFWYSVLMGTGTVLNFLPEVYV